MLGGEALWKKARGLLSAAPRQQELRWLQRNGEAKFQAAIAKLAGEQEDHRVRLWLRLRLGGQRASDLARELGYADGSGPWRVAHRLEAASAEDADLRKILDELRGNVTMSSVRS